MSLTLPDTVFVRPGDVLNCGAGISRRMLDAVVDAGVLKRHIFPGCTHGVYRRQDVVRVFRLEEETVGAEAVGR